MASFCSLFLEAITGTNGDATVCEALVTQQSAFVHTVLIYVRFSEIDGLHSYGQIVIH